jgi:hypothetical protein
LGASELYCFPKSCPTLAGNVNFNDCNMEPTRLNDAKCALRQSVEDFSQEVSFGLATYAVRLSACTGGPCGDSCTVADGSCNPPSGVATEGEFFAGNGCSVSAFPSTNGASASCGNQPDCGTAATPQIMPANWENGGNIVVPILQDPTWGATQPVTNVAEVLKWVDGSCDESKELFGIGFTPLFGVLSTVHQYLAAGWSSQWADGNYCATGGAAMDFLSPVEAALDRTCRSVNVIFVTDGQSVASQCGGDPAAAAVTLFNTGVTIQGVRVPVRTFVIGFGGFDQAATALNPIADAGDDGLANASRTAPLASDAEGLRQAISSVVQSTLTVEACDNGVDDDCDGCTDEECL